MRQDQIIEHDGIVRKITDKNIMVDILVQEACASCKVKGACGVSEGKEKTIEVPLPDQVYKAGEHVRVYMKQSLGFHALFYGYILPFLIVFAILITLMVITENELLAGISSISVLIPYYITLYLLRNSLRKQFSFSIKKQVLV